MTSLDTTPGPRGSSTSPDRRSRFPVWLAIVAASLPRFMATLDNLVMTTALTVIRDDLGASVGRLSWFLNAYMLTFAVFMLPGATLGDRLGRPPSAADRRGAITPQADPVTVTLRVMIPFM